MNINCEIHLCFTVSQESPRVDPANHSLHNDILMHTNDDDDNSC